MDTNSYIEPDFLSARGGSDLFEDRNNSMSQEISSLSEIQNEFDLYIFCNEKTLIQNGMTLPSTAIRIPALRKLGKTIAVYESNPLLSPQSIVKKLTYHGFSFRTRKILNENNLSQLHLIFPFIDKSRILMVCDNDPQHIESAQLNGFKTVLVMNGSDKKQNIGLYPADYVTQNV